MVVVVVAGGDVSIAASVDTDVAHVSSAGVLSRSSLRDKRRIDPGERVPELLLAGMLEHGSLLMMVNI